MTSGTLTIEPIKRRNPWLNAKLIVAASVLALVVGFLVFNAMGSSMAYYQTVGELRSAGRDVTGEQIRVGGDVVPGSVAHEELSDELRFTITDGANTLPVVYEGIVPDIFSEEVEVVAEGTIGPDGVMVANHLLTKCPSRFETADGAS